MANLYGKSWTRDELLQRVGDISQLARIKPTTLADGFEDGVKSLDVTNGSGLTFSVLASRGLDISTATYNGHALAWRSAQTDKHPAFFEPTEKNWLRTFYGGLLVTCGLTTIGMDSEDAGQKLGLHGRASHLPATYVTYSGEWEGDEYHLSVSGKMREAIIFGENIEWRRTIHTRLGEKRFWVIDEVENMGYSTSPHMFLYHINLGFPVVNENSRFFSPTVVAEPRDSVAEVGKEDYNRFQPPTSGFNEKCYFHTMKPNAEGLVTTGIVNPDLLNGEGLGLYVTYHQSQFPYFCEWKMMGQGNYVVGLEPGNALVLGRAKERELGRLQFIEPGEIRKYHTEFGVVSGKADIDGLIQKTSI
ncbi:MAG: aldose 1-epimerase family protein [Chthonomonadales bacterium]